MRALKNCARTALSHTRTEPSLEAESSAEAPGEPLCSAIAVCSPTNEDGRLRDTIRAGLASSGLASDVCC